MSTTARLPAKSPEGDSHSTSRQMELRISSCRFNRNSCSATIRVESEWFMICFKSLSGGLTVPNKIQTICLFSPGSEGTGQRHHRFETNYKSPQLCIRRISLH